jgi:hypothetical protein
MPNGTVIPIDRNQHPSFTGMPGSFDSSPDHRISISVDGNTVLQPENAKVLTPAELYPDLDDRDGPVIQALRLLTDCLEQITLAGQIDPGVDFTSYDERMMRASDSLRKLYALRDIGDGFGASINALMWAIRNKDTEALSGRQTSTMLEVIKQLRNKPMLHFDSAMTLLDQLEDSELNIEPPFVELLTDLDPGEPDEL